METTFDFTESEYVRTIDSKTVLYIKRMNHSIAILYFTDELSNKINIPDGIVVYQYDYQNIKKRVVLHPIEKSYPLSWSDNYTIELNQNVLLIIKNQRRWSIIS